MDLPQSLSRKELVFFIIIITVPAYPVQCPVLSRDSETLSQLMLREILKSIHIYTYVGVKLGSGIPPAGPCAKGPPACATTGL